MTGFLCNRDRPKLSITKYQGKLASGGSTSVMGRAASYQAGRNLQEEANHRGRRVLVLHGGQRPIYASAASEGGDEPPTILH